ncbi:MAG: ABC transporter ATP-binding protein [Conexivisphaerales archaeon]
MEHDPVLDVRELSVDYFSTSGNIHALDRISISIAPSEFLGLVGESGSGKSTLAYTIIRLLPSNAKVVGGKILFEDKDIFSLNDGELRLLRGQKISMVFQDPTTSLNPIFKVKDQICRVIELHKHVDRRTAVRMAEEYIALAELPEPELVLNSFPFELSGGMQQRVMIAMALSMSPTLIIADEPTSAVDATIQAGILNLLSKLKNQQKFSMLFITHNLDVVNQVCDRVAVMYAGKVVEIAKKKDIFLNAKHPYTQALLASVPRPRVNAREDKHLAIIPGNVPDMLNPPPGCRFHPRCPFAMTRCKMEVPELREVEDCHFVACHLY